MSLIIRVSPSDCKSFQPRGLDRPGSKSELLDRRDNSKYLRGAVERLKAAPFLQKRTRL